MRDAKRRAAPRASVHVLVLATLAGLAGERSPRAQSMTPPGRGAEPQQSKEGPAEADPREPEVAPPSVAPAWPRQLDRVLQFFQLAGSLRLRAALFHDFNLGVHEGASAARSPFYVPYSGYGKSDGPDNLTSADMRLRLDPTLHVSDYVRVHARLDVFDDWVLGSTPAVPSVVAKRAWAEVRTPWAQLSFGRMPSAWGLGMMLNDGSCLDCDGGATSDRVMLSTKLWDHVFSFMWDWVASGPTTQVIDPNAAVAYNADGLDDASQWVLTISRQLEPDERRQRLALGRGVLEYGAWLAYRQQDWAQRAAALDATRPAYQALQNDLEPRRAKAFVGDVFLRYERRHLRLEIEGAVTAGTIGNQPSELDPKQPSALILSGGVAARGEYRLLGDKLGLHLEAGYASGDDAGLVTVGPDGSRRTDVSLWRASPAKALDRVSRFAFDPDYQIDLILFRRILGTVSNAAYFKGGASYRFLDRLRARADVIYSLAPNPASYPGTSRNLGVEIDAALSYEDPVHGFVASLRYGVLFPLGGLAFPSDGASPAPSPGIPQCLQLTLAVRF